MQKKHNLDFCPQCGNKLEGIEDFCPECGNKLVEVQPKQEPIVQNTPPPVVEQEKKVEPVKEEVKQVIPPQMQTQNTTTTNNGSSGFPWMKLIIIVVIVAAVGVGGFFVATKTNLLSGGSKSNSSDLQIASTNKYFVCYSTASVNGKVKATVSNIIVATEPSQDIEWAKGLFQKSLKSKLGGENKYFKKSFAKSFNSMDEATKGARDMKDDYKNKGYQLKTLRIEY